MNNYNIPIKKYGTKYNSNLQKLKRDATFASISTTLNQKQVEMA